MLSSSLQSSCTEDARHAVVEHCQWQCWQELIAKAIQFKPLSLLITASGNVIWLQQSFNLRENFSRIFHVDFLMNLSFINFTRRGSCKRNFELQ